jgi:hypothetical protein
MQIQMKKNASKLIQPTIKALYKFENNAGSKKRAETDPTTITTATISHIITGGW